MDKVLLVQPKYTVDFAVGPIDAPLEETISDGDYWNGYLHKSPTYNNYRPDGGHHIGTDFNLGEKDEDFELPLQLIMNGVCIFTGSSTRDLGKIALFRHRLPNGEELFSRYAHLNDYSAVPRENYFAGDIVATMGKSGMRGMGVHLHMDLGNIYLFETHYSGIWEDPWWYIHNLDPGNEDQDPYLPIIDRFFVDPVAVIKKYINPIDYPKLNNKISKLEQKLRWK